MAKRLQLFLAFLFAQLVHVDAQSLAKASVTPTISIVTNDGNYTESTGALCFSISINNPAIDTTKVDLVVLPGSTGNVTSDFTYSPTTIRFAPNFSGNEYVCLTIVDDTLAEPIEQYQLKLTNATNGAVLVDSLISFTVYDDDSISTNNPCNDLFFSEFVHSYTANDRGLEIYNPSGQVVDLSEYSLHFYFAGSSTAGDTLQLTGFLNHGSTYTICSAGSDSLLRIKADTVDPQFFYNGSNAIGLFHNNNLIDCFGIIGVDPGPYWPTGSGTTTSSTLVRKQTIKQGESSWAISNGQWNVFPQGDYSHFGSHTINGCGFVVPPTITMFTSDASFPESVGGLGISAKIFNPGSTAITVDVIVGGASTAQNNVDFMYSPSQLVFPAGVTTNQFISIGILDETLVEADELLELKLTNASNGAIILDSTWLLTIENDDFLSVKKNSPDGLIQIRPNPVKDVLSVSGNLTYSSFEVVNLLGQTEIRGDLMHAEAEGIVVKALEPGTYFLRLKSADGWKTLRFVKE